MRSALRWGGLCLCIPLCYLLAAAVGAFVPSGSITDTAQDKGIILVSGPIHYDLLIPLDDDLRHGFSFLADADIPLYHPDAEWLVIGWGAKTFYTQTQGYEHTSARAVWRGIVGDDSVLRVDVLSAINPRYGERVQISNQQYDALTQNILASFADRQKMDVPGFTPTDAFFPAKGRFHIFRTCNVWIGEQLRAAGLKFGAWTPTPYSVRWALQWHVSDRLR